MVVQIVLWIIDSGCSKHMTDHEGYENVIDESLPPRNDELKILGTRLEPMSDKESPEVEITNDEERREKGKIVEESRSIPFPTPIRSPRIHTDLASSDTKKLQELTELQGRYTYLFKHQKTTLADHLQEIMVESLPTMVDTHIKEQVKKQVLEQVRDQVLVYVADGLILERQKTKEEMERMIAKAILQERGNIKAEISSQIQNTIDNHIPSQVPQTTCRPSAIRPRDQDDPHDDAHPEGENCAKRQKTSEYEAYVSGESSSGQVNENEQGPSTSGNQEQEDDYDFWTESYVSDDYEIPTEQMSQDIMEEVSLTIDEAKLKKMTIPLVQSCQRDPEAPPLSIINQDLLYLKKGSSGPEKICVKKFNPYARYGVEHWKNTYAKIFYIRKQKEPRKPKEVIYSNSKIIQVIKTYWELGHEHKFITKIVARRANECIVSITEPDYKNLNKNDIEDMFMLIMNGKVPDYAKTRLLWSLSVFIRSLVLWERVHDFQLRIENYQQKVNLTAPTISFPGVEKHKMVSIIYEPMYGIIYKNSKKEKRVMRHSEIHKDLTNKEVEYLKLFEEEIEVRLKYQNQMRRWEMYVNGRPLGPRREHPE
ncbi:hypothetical protein Tco_0620350 [Tanacetum coccineum]